MMYRLRAFGGLVLERDGVRLDGVARHRKALSLLAALAVHGSLGRDRLMALLWPESDAGRAKGSLKQAVHLLRRQLAEPDLLVGTAELRLNPDRIESDVQLFTRALDAGAAEAAVALYDGPFLDGVHLDGTPEFERWADERRAELAGRHARALEDLARGAEARGDPLAAAGWWRRLQAADPFSGRVALHLMQALEAAGDRAAALRHADAHDLLLREELGIAADPTILDLAEQLRSPATPGPAGASPTAGAPDRPVLPRPASPPPAAGSPPASAPARLPAPDPDAHPATPAPAAPRLRRGFRIAALFLVAALAIGVGVLATTGERLTSDARADPRGPLIVVLPFAPASHDPALEQAGRDLVVTLSAGLDGMGELRTVDPLSTLERVPRGQALPIERAQRLARGMAADRLVHGVLIRDGDGLRLDAAIYPTGGTEPAARASVTAGQLSELSDAITVALLDQLWQREPPPVPSLAPVMKSTVPAARRAYIAGELALARSDMPGAIDAFERAFAMDTTFWWAYWRSLYPRGYAETSLADPALVQKVIDHRWKLPATDRRLIEVTRLSRSVGERITRLRLLIDQFPDYEPARWEYADWLAHRGSYLGHTLEDTRSALEQVLALNPRFAPAWDHLLWVALVQGDSATAMRAAQQAAQLVGSTATPHSRKLRHLRASLFEPGPIPAERLDEWVEVVLSGSPGHAEALAVRLLADGFPAKQIQVNRAVRERTTNAALAAALWRGEALAWAARGAWDATLVAADQWVLAATGTGGRAELDAYRLAIAAAMLGAVPAAEARRRRSSAASAIARWSTGSAADCDTMLLDSAALAAGRDGGPLRCESQVRQATYQRIDLAWLDGLLAYLENEPSGIRSARRALSADPAEDGQVAGPVVSPWDSLSRPMLDRSLAALLLDAAGDREGAAREMVAVEMDIANHLAPDQVSMFHPLLRAANRMIAATWLQALGEDAEAARLLTWHEAIRGQPLAQAWNLSVGTLSLLDRAEIAEAMGELDRARSFYTRFLARHDLPVAALEPRVARAEAALTRLAAEPAR
jgi:DNA-binding SARP family transcriptional activator